MTAHKRRASESTQDDIRSRKRSKTPPDVQTVFTQGDAPTGQPSVIPLDYDALDGELSSQPNYQDLLALGEVSLPFVLTAIVGGTKGLDPQYTVPPNAQRLLESDESLKRILLECINTGAYSRVRSHPSLLPPPNIDERLAEGRARFLPRLLALVEAAHAVFATHSPDGSPLQDVEMSIRSDDPVMEMRVNELFVRGRNILLLGPDGSGKTELVAAAVAKHFMVYLPTIRDRDQPFGSESFARALHHIALRPGRTNPDGAAPSLPHHEQTADFYALAVLAYLIVFDWLLECLDTANIHDLLRCWAYIQFFPMANREREQDDIFVSVLKLIEDCKDSQAIDKIFGELQERRERRLGHAHMFIAVDDFEHATQNGRRCISSQTDASNDQLSSALREMAFNWSTCPRFRETTVIFSGAILPLRLANGPSGSFLKIADGWKVYPSLMTFDTEDTQRRFIMEKMWGGKALSGLSEHDQAILSRSWSWLRGRYRYTATYVAALQRFTTRSAHRILNKVVEHITGGYVPVDGVSYSEGEPSLGEDIKTFIKSIPKIEINRMYDDPVVEAYVREALLHYVTTGGGYELAGQAHRAVSMGLARIPAKGPGFLIVDDLADCPEALSCLDLIIDEPLCLAAALVSLRQRQRNPVAECLEGNYLDLELDVPGHSLHAKDAAALAMAHIFGGNKSLRDLFSVRGTHRQTYLRQPIKLIAITRRGTDNSLVTEDFQMSRDSAPTLAFKANNRKGIEHWCKGTGIPFLYPNFEVYPASGPDLLCLCRAGRQHVWISVEIESKRDKELRSCAQPPRIEHQDVWNFLPGLPGTSRVDKSIPLIRVLLRPSRAVHTRTPERAIGQKCIEATLENFDAQSIFPQVSEFIESAFASRIAHRG